LVIIPMWCVAWRRLALARSFTVSGTFISQISLTIVVAGSHDRHLETVKVWGYNFYFGVGREPRTASSHSGKPGGRPSRIHAAGRPGG
jgi:hypothetical protein